MPFKSDTHTDSNSPPQPDPAEIERGFDLIFAPGEVHELRALDTRQGTVSGYFTDREKFTEAVLQASNSSLEAPGIFTTLNPCTPELLSRAVNRWKPYAKNTTSDADIVRRRWIIGDFDSKRPAGICDTDEQHHAALQRAHDAREFLRELGWPDPVYIDSGNGGYLLYRVDQPNDDKARDLIRRCLEVLASRFNDDAVIVDRTMFNAARIVRIPGSINRKGDFTTDRPHRLVKILEVPDVIEVVTREQLEKLAALAPSAQSNNGSHDHSDLDNFIARHSIKVAKINDWNGWRRYILESCIFNSAHVGTSAAILQSPSGVPVFKCQHNGCADKKWADVLALFGETATAIKEPPRPLYRELPEGDSFPVKALGKIGAAAAQKIQEATGAPMAICGQSVLAAMNLAVVGHIDIEMPTGEVKPSSEYFATIASSGERKTAGDNRAAEEFKKHEMRKEQSYRTLMSTYANKLEAWERARAEALKQPGTKEAKEAALQKLGDKPEAPISPMLLVGGDPTIEGLAKLFHEGGVSVAGMFTNEGAQFVGGWSMADDLRMRTAGALSKLWDGDPMPRVRGGDGFFTIKGRRLAAHILIQPEAAQRLFGDPILQDQGLLTRFLTSMPARTAGSRPFVKVRDFSQLSLFSQRLRNLLDQPLSYTDPLHPRAGLKPAVLKLSAGAAKLWVKFYDYVEGLIGPGQGKVLDEVVGLANKAAEHATRLAGTIAYFNTTSCKTISTEHMQAGIDLVGYYLSEALRIRMAATISADLDLAGKLLRWLHDGWSEANGLISLPDIYQQCPNHGLHSKADATRIAKILEDHGWLERVAPTKVNGTPRREVWRIVKE